tara:strand:+ start:1283 stop:1903 length:621 start_codon:yes stop_codon:yes gene_type:complete
MGLISNGTTIFDAGALDSGLAKGAMTLIKTLTASSSGTLTFHNGTSSVVLDSTYKEYLFIFNNLHPSATDGPLLVFQANAVGASGFNETITSTCFITFQFEDNSQSAVSYSTGGDQAQGTAYQRLSQNVGGENNECVSGSLSLFDPASTVFVKHFIARASAHADDDGNTEGYNAGYFNVTAAIDEIQFKFASGNIDSGTISLYGIN